jgi:ATP-dependent exoDNAse (exonuclease V) beta subunit
LRSSPFDQEKITNWYANAASLKAHLEEAIRQDLPDKVATLVDSSDEGDLISRIQAAFKAVGIPAPAWAKGKVDPTAEQDGLRHTCGLVQIACAAWWRLDREMTRMQALDFAALEIKADRLLKRSEVTRQRLAEQYKVVMVDESQDVNPIQYNLLNHLGTERTMMVGDAQQSIYGFRQADVRLFQQRSEATSTKRLAKNWRSVDGILNFVDVVFSRLWAPDYQPMNLNTGPMDFESDVRPTFEGVELWRQASKDTRGTVGHISELLGEGVSRNDIAILVRDSIGAQAMQQALNDANIPNRIAGGSERFYTRLEVRDLANALRALADPYDDFALLATLRSPMVGLTLDSITLLGLKSPVVESLDSFEPPLVEDIPRLRAFLDWYVPLRKVADRLSAWEVLSELFAQSEYLPALARRAKGEQMLANVRKLLTLAAEEPELGPLEFAERIREIQDLRHKEGDAPADDEKADLVKIMTIHKAKGLEWPVVIVPQTEKKLSSRARDVVADPALGLVATKFSKGQSLAHKFLSEKKKRREDEEEKRVLYVALTRAQNRLCICLFPPSNYPTISKLIEGVIDPEQMPGLRVRG